MPASNLHRASRAAALLAPVLCALLLLLALLAPAPHAFAAGLAFREQSLHLPGAPAALVPADLDGDGVRDLAVVVVYTEWDQIGVEELTEMDQVEGLVEVLTIVPVLLDRREVRAFLGRPGGGLEPAGEPLPLPLSVLSLEPGPPGIPALALTDDGASALRFDRAAGRLILEPVVADPPVLAGTGTFLGGLGLVQDATGDGIPDLLLPAPDGIALYRGTGQGLAAEADSRTPLPGDPADPGGRTLDYPLPRVEDLDGDGLPDLLFRVSARRGSDGWQVLRRLPSAEGPARFAEPVPVRLPPRESAAAEGEDDRGRDDESSGRSPAWLGRLAPDGPGAAVRLESLDDEDAGMRKSLAQAREPSYRVHLHPLAPDRALDLAPASEPAVSFEVKGYVLGDQESDLTLPGGFQDLNGDGRTDLVTVTNDVSLFKALAVLATRRLTLELGFHPYCQEPDGRLVRAPGDPLTSRLTIDLDDLALRQRSLFAGDFDGDGRADFLQLGRRREIGVHRGRADCSYPARADATIRLRDELRDLALVEARDLDGDGRTDLAVTHLQRVDEPGVTQPVRLDLYLTRGAGGGER
ncbi:MAG TPA: VCBS repeat-containing protein [Thermoanaerobaculia bacterium]|nr:VCBS repeat-containing protein [Thermoanaerobaculia bacterium]